MSKKIILSKNKKTKIGKNVLVVGESGSGKTYGFVIPNLLQMNASYVVNDHEGYLYKTVGEILRQNGYKVKVLDVSDPAHSNHYNPFSYFNGKLEPLFFADHLAQYLNAIHVDEEVDTFVRMTEQIYLRTCISYCAECFGKNCTLATVGDMLDKFASETEEGNAEFHALFQSLPDDSNTKLFYMAFCQNPTKTQMKIMKNVQTKFHAFILEGISDLPATDDLELDKVCEEKTAIFLIDHGTGLYAHGFLFSFLYTQLFEILAEKTKGDQTASPVHILMDEFPNFPFIKDLPEIMIREELSLISISVVIQDISQLMVLYPETWKDFANKCFDKILFLGSPSLATIEFFSDKYKIGNDTLLSTGKKALLIGDEKNLILDEKFAGKDHKNWK